MYKLISISVLALALTACASTGSVEEVSRKADAALEAANAAQTCCTNNQERLERMYQKIMTK